MSQYVWLNNKVINIKNTDLPFFDEGFLYGQGLFETMRSYDGEVFLLDRHIKRLVKSCPIMNIACKDRNLLKRAVQKIIKKNKLNSGYIRLNVYKKKNSFGIFVFTKRKHFYSQKDYQNGFSAIISKRIRQNETSPLVKIKSLNHYFYILLSKEAKNHGVDEVIILNNKGNICEGSRSNIFVVKNNIILTPSLNCGCLPGITRQVVLEIIKKLGINFKETEIKPKDLYNSKEAFLTNSLIEIMPLTKIDGKLIGNGKIGKITESILKTYRQLIKIGYK